MSVSTAEATTWKLDPVHSQVQFSVKHMMITNVKGEFSDLDGTVVLDTDDPDNSSVEVEIDASSIDTGVEDRDQHLRSGDFLDVETHPAITFKGGSIEGDLAPGSSFQLAGELTIRGETREVTLDVDFEGVGQDPWGGERVGFSASTVIDRRDFGLTWNQALETGGILVGHDVKISLEVQAVKADG